MSANKKVYCDKVKSKLNELYASIDEIANRKAVLNLYDVPITFDAIIERFKHQPFFASVPKSPLLEMNKLDFNRIEETKKSIFNLPKSKETAVISMVKIEDFPHVKFMPSEMITVGNQKKFAAPRFTIDLSACKIEPYCGVRINTGYIINIPKIAVGRTVSNGKIVTTTKGGQPEIIIIPQIVSKHPGLVQAIYGRDPEDTGLFTINFTTTKEFDNKTKMQIVLNGFVIDQPLGQANLYNGESNLELFKAKDNRTGRYIRNPRTKFTATNFDTTTIPGSLLLSTFDATKTPSVPYEKQKIKIDKLITLFTTRKREWCDPKILTSVGIYNPVNNKHFEGIMLKSPDVNLKHNTHGIVFVKHRLTIFSINGSPEYEFRILNGAFFNIPQYNEVNRDIRKARSSLIDLSTGVTICRDTINSFPEYNINDLIRVFDYDRSLPSYDSRLPQKVKYDDEKLYNERPAELNCYSVVLYKSLRSLAYLCCSDLFTPDQLKALSLLCTKAAANDQDEGDNDKNSPTPNTTNSSSNGTTNGCKRSSDDAGHNNDDDDDNSTATSTNNDIKTTNDETDGANEAKRVKVE